MKRLVDSARLRLGLLGVTLLAGVLVAGASAAILANSDFQTGDLTGWTTFVTSNGTIGSATVASFDTSGTGASDAARFSVGAAGFPIGSYEGGGIYQFVTTSSGLFNLAADGAAYNPTFVLNHSCGLFELLVDGGVVASHDFGGCDGGTTVRSTLTATGLSLSAGEHEIRVRITRPYLALAGAPVEYVDNVSLTPALPTAKDNCKNGGWQNFPVFKNQGDCVSFIATGGKNQPALG